MNQHSDPQIRVGFYTNLTARESLPVLRSLVQLDRVLVSQVIFYDTLNEARSSPLKILKEFGLRRVMSKLVGAIFSKFRLSLLKGPWPNCVRPRSSFEFAVAQRIPSCIVSNLNSHASQERLRQWGLDLLIVCVCKNILKEVTLKSFPLGTVNIHPSMLPQYRGPMPIFWMLYHGDSQGGVTFQKMTTQIDWGPIVAQYPLTLDLSQSESEISQSLFQLAAAKLDEVLERIIFPQGSAERPELNLDKESGSYFSYPSAADQAELRRILRKRAP